MCVCVCLYIYIRAFFNLKFGKCDCVGYRLAYFGPGKGRPLKIRQNAMCFQNRSEYCGVTKLRFA